MVFQAYKLRNDVKRHLGIKGRESWRKNPSIKALFLGEECADNFAPDHGEEKVFLNYADFWE